MLPNEPVYVLLAIGVLVKAVVPNVTTDEAKNMAVVNVEQ